ncbi:hypothetical protein FTV90_25770 (plasmid) [Escherichia coli]|nr:hypothetical protein FTV90_25770 [Escherichia coli]
MTSYTAREAYRVVYRQLATLQRHHFVIKTNAQDGVFKYQKTSKFSETAIVAKSSSRQRVMHIERISITTGTAIQSAHSYDGDLIAALRHTAYQYQADLLAAIGESEEYQRLAKDHPTLKNLFESDQREAADKRAKLRGNYARLRPLSCNTHGLCKGCQLSVWVSTIGEKHDGTPSYVVMYIPPAAFSFRR